MRKYFLPTVIVCVLVLATVSVITGFWNDAPKMNVTRVGFVYSEDESTPYTANFVKAQHALEDEYGVSFSSGTLVYVTRRAGAKCRSWFS